MTITMLGKCERIILPWLTYLTLYSFVTGVNCWDDLYDGEVRNVVGMARSLLVANGMGAPKDCSKLQVSYQVRHSGPSDGVPLMEISSSCFIIRDLKVENNFPEVLKYSVNGIIYSGMKKMVS